MKSTKYSRSFDKYLAKQHSKNEKRKISISKLIIYSSLIIWTLVCLFPFFWAISASFNRYQDISSVGLNPIPSKPTLQNYEFLFNSDFTSTNIQTWFRNSFIYATSTALLNIFFDFLAGYGLARIKFKGRKIVYWYLIVGMMIPAQVTQIPQLILLIRMNFIGSNISDTRFFIGIIFTGMTSATWIFLIRQFFINQSKSVEEAARMDGLSLFGTLTRISFRQMIPLITTIFTMVFMAAWNNFIMFTLWSGGDPNRMTLVAGLQVVGESAFAIAPDFVKTVTLAATNLVVIPVILLYLSSLWFQRKSVIEGEK